MSLIPAQHLLQPKHESWRTEQWRFPPRLTVTCTYSPIPLVTWRCKAITPGKLWEASWTFCLCITIIYGRLQEKQKMPLASSLLNKTYWTDFWINPLDSHASQLRRKHKPKQITQKSSTPDLSGIHKQISDQSWIWSDGWKIQLHGAVAACGVSVWQPAPGAALQLTPKEKQRGEQTAPSSAPSRCKCRSWRKQVWPKPKTPYPYSVKKWITRKYQPAVRVFSSQRQK